MVLKGRMGESEVIYWQYRIMRVCLCVSGGFLLSLPVFLPCLWLLLRPRGGKKGNKFRHLRQVRWRRSVHQLPGMYCVSSLNGFLCLHACGRKQDRKGIKIPCLHLYVTQVLCRAVDSEQFSLKLVQTGVWGQRKHWFLNFPRNL